MGWRQDFFRLDTGSNRCAIVSFQDPEISHEINKIHVQFHCGDIRSAVIFEPSWRNKMDVLQLKNPFMKHKSSFRADRDVRLSYWDIECGGGGVFTCDLGRCGRRVEVLVPDFYNTSL
jgi:hypothetical protein